MNDKFSSLVFSFQTTLLRFIASPLPRQTKLLTESYLFLISLLFSPVFVLFSIGSFFLTLHFLFPGVSRISKASAGLVSLQLARATQWDVIRTYVTTWQTVINSNCINGSNLKNKKMLLQQLKTGSVK